MCHAQHNELNYNSVSVLIQKPELITSIQIKNNCTAFIIHFTVQFDTDKATINNKIIMRFGHHSSLPTNTYKRGTRTCFICISIIEPSSTVNKLV